MLFIHAKAAIPDCDSENEWMKIKENRHFGGIYNVKTAY